MTCLAVLFSVGSSQTREARWPSVGFVEVADTTASARLRCDHPQKPGFGISRRDHPSVHPALRHAAAEPPLYRRHAWQEAGRTGRIEEGGRHRSAQRVGAEAVVEAQRVAAAKTACLTTVRHGELSHGRRWSGLPGRRPTQPPNVWDSSRQLPAHRQC